LGAGDLLVVGAYLAATVVLGVRASRRPLDPAEDYLLAGRTLTLPSFVVTLVSTWYGGVLGVGEYSYLHGLSNWLVLGAPYYVGALLFALLFARRARERADFTVPDLLHDVYGRPAALVGALTVLALSLPAAYLLMLGVLVRRATGLPQSWGIVLSALFCLAYVAVRGFRSVVQTKGLQFAFMYGGFLLLLPIAVVTSGGPAFLAARLPAGHFEPLGGQTLGYVVAWYFIALQTLVEPTFFQRCFAARSPAIARKGIYVSILFFALFDGLTTTTGMYARALLPDLPSGVDAFPALGELLLPAGLLGVFYAGLLATILSTVDSYLFVGGVTVGRDLVGRILGDAFRTNRVNRIGLLAATAIATGVALGSESVVSLWYGFGSVGTAVLLVPLLGVFYPSLRPSRRYVAAGMATAGIVTLVWLLGSYADPAGRPWLSVEPVYVGLVTAVAVHGLGRLASPLARAGV
jgi:SSS family solute:Na+ symporter